MCLAHSMDDLLDVGMGKRVTLSSTENLVVPPSPEHDANLPPSPQQQQAGKWGMPGTYVHVHPSTVRIGSVPKQMILNTMIHTPNICICVHHA